MTPDGPLLPWLLVKLRPMNRTRVKQLLKHGCVSVNGVPVTRHDHLLAPSDKVEIARDTGPQKRELDQAKIAITCEDAAVIVIDKPAGLLTVATEGEKDDTAYVRVKGYLKAKRERPFVVHRIDRETSGLLLFAKSEAVRDQLQATWAGATKIYLAITEGTPKPLGGTIANNLMEGRDLKVRVSFDPLAKPAVTHYRLVSRHGARALVEVTLETGRKHQIRAHLADLGTPVIGDTFYGATTDPARRIGLHAWKLAFAHPLSAVQVELESALPVALQRVLT